MPLLHMFGQNGSKQNVILLKVTYRINQRRTKGWRGLSIHAWQILLADWLEVPCWQSGSNRPQHA
eukprot:1289168-Amphidinium_carterae.1